MTVYVNAKSNQFMKVLPTDFDTLQISKNNWEEVGFHFIAGEATHFGALDTQQVGDLFQVFKRLNFRQKMNLCNQIRANHGLNLIKIQDEFDEYFTEHQSDGSTQQDFLNELETGDEGIINDFSSSFSLIDWSDLEYIVLDYFNNAFGDTKYHFWRVTGFSQGELAYVWYYDFTDEEPVNADEKFKDDYQSNFEGETFTDVFENILYGTAVTILPCNSSGFSNEDDWCKSRYVAGLTTDDEMVSEYMSKAYNMVPAKKSVHYYA